MLREFCPTLFFVPVPVAWAVYFITSIYRMDFFILLTSFTMVKIRIYFQS